MLCLKVWRVIRFDGLDIQKWNTEALRSQIGVIFQDFVRYQLTAGENIGVGDVDALMDEERWAQAAVLGMAAPLIEEWEQKYNTQLGGWFNDGREISGGQWQKVALSRAFMRQDAKLLILDEPTAAMDAAAEAQVFSHFEQATKSTAADRMAILISHRFSTVRMADTIVVLDKGRVVEQGNHETLMENNGMYAKLFTLQAKGYL